MKRFKRNQRNKTKIFILSSIIFVTLFMAIGYAILNQEIKLKGTVNFYATDKYLWHKLTTDYVVTTGSGFYSNTLENNKYSYVGNGTTNYITFNNELWRIVSIEADNTIKIVKWNNTFNKEFDEVNNRTSNSTYCINLTYGCNAWNSKITLTNGTITGSVENDSSLNTYLNTTFYNSLLPESQNLVVEHSFNVGAVSSGSTLESAIGSEIEQTWTGKVGLLTISEMLYPSNSTNMTIGTTTYSNNYLLEFTNNLNYILTMTSVSDDSSKIWTITYDTQQIGKDANLTSETINGITYNYIVLPTLYLKDTVEYVSGNGELDSPFTIK